MQIFGGDLWVESPLLVLKIKGIHLGEWGVATLEKVGNGSASVESMPWPPLLAEVVLPRVGPLVFLGVTERVLVKTVSHGWRDQVYDTTLGRQLHFTRRMEGNIDDTILANLCSRLCAKKPTPETPNVELNVAECVELSDASIAGVCASLASLNVRRCHKPTNASIATAATGCASLVSPDVAECSEFTDTSMETVAASCASLAELNVVRCGKLTEKSIVSIAAGFASLATLDVRCCH